MEDSKSGELQTSYLEECEVLQETEINIHLASKEIGNKSKGFFWGTKRRRLMKIRAIRDKMANGFGNDRWKHTPGGTYTIKSKSGYELYTIFDRVRGNILTTHMYNMIHADYNHYIVSGVLEWKGNTNLDGNSYASVDGDRYLCAKCINYLPTRPNRQTPIWRSLRLEID
ncbi:hypothetical protein Lal_00023937 [Lupinus albus]|nr:hypothetical protein Lal_00023937 [Lupinus albus]